MVFKVYGLERSGSRGLVWAKVALVGCCWFCKRHPDLRGFKDDLSFRFCP